MKKNPKRRENLNISKKQNTEIKYFKKKNNIEKHCKTLNEAIQENHLMKIENGNMNR